MSTDRPTVSVVIRAFTEERLLDTRAAIDSVLKQTRRPDEVLVIVDKNPKLFAVLSSEYSSRNTVVVRSNNRPQGIGGGGNTGLALASGEVICFLDDDATADPCWLSSLLDPFADRAIVAVGGLTIPRWDAGRAPAWFPAEFNWTVGCSNPQQSQVVTDLRNVWGGNSAFRRAIVVDNGGFVEKGLGRIGSNSLGGEDTELCIRLRRADPKNRIVFQPAAIIYHRVSEQRATFKYFNKRCRMEGLSKALLSHQVGSREGLGQEASYASKDLPKAVLRLTANGCRHQRLAEFRQAAMIVLGLASAVAGMVYGRAKIAAGHIEALEPIERPLPAVPVDRK